MVALLFSYGTLRQPEVQRAVFGREISGTPDALTGFVLATVEIDDPDVVEVSGKAVHSILLPGAGPAIAGVALDILPEDLAPADAYETAAYARVVVTLASGRAAYAYVAAGA